VGGIDPVLAPADAGLAGRVVMAGGQPLQGILVEAYVQGYHDTWTLAGAAHTDAAGNFVLGHLTAGVYRIFCMDAKGRYLARYFGDSGEFGTAAKVTVAGGVTEPSVNVELVPVNPP
jgi:hypothetical protein